MVEVGIRVDMRYSYVEVDGQQVVKITPAGFEMVVAVLKYVEETHELLIGRNSADMAILQCRRDENCLVTLRGRNMQSGFPTALDVTTSEIISTISEILDQIVQQLAVNLAVKLKGLEYYDPDNQRLLPNTLETDQAPLTGESKDIFELMRTCEQLSFCKRYSI